MNINYVGPQTDVDDNTCLSYILCFYGYLIISSTTAFEWKENYSTGVIWWIKGTDINQHINLRNINPFMISIYLFYEKETKFNPSHANNQGH